ncbi:MAG: peptide chain release factor N(5)-glutamine methyltransferase [Magnetococcales bacterium]|nr:peptide chain release factor N(5)-glutamine methyltransferase [Magnetococcales bacterium]
MGGSVWTIRSLLQWSAPWLARRGADTPRLDAELLLADVLHLQRIGLFLDPDRPLTPSELADFKSRLRRREAREPVAYIVGKKDFWKDTFVVNRSVLIPRPETETLLEIVLRAFPERNGAWSLLDVGCGSGAVLISLLREFPNAVGTGLDLSTAALQVSRQNGQRLGLDVGRQVRWLQSDLMANLAQDARFDAILANPPYIPSREMSALQPEIVRYEPHLALDGGADGLDVIRRLVDSSSHFLNPRGLLAIEVDSRQAGTVAGWLTNLGFTGVGTQTDCYHHPRVVFGLAPTSSV